MESVIRAAQVVVDDGLARPILIGRPEIIAQRVARAGLRLRLGEDIQVVDLSDGQVDDAHWRDYHAVMGRHGVTPDMARTTLQRSRTAVAAMMVRRGDADAMICGVAGRFDAHLHKVENLIGRDRDACCLATMNAVMLPEHTLFITDTFVHEDPDAETLAHIARMAA